MSWERRVCSRGRFRVLRAVYCIVLCLQHLFHELMCAGSWGGSQLDSFIWYMHSHVTYEHDHPRVSVTLCIGFISTLPCEIAGYTPYGPAAQS